MVANPAKFQYMFLCKHKTLKTKTEKFDFESTTWIKLLGLTIEHNLKFDTNTSWICKTAGAKIKILSRAKNALDEKPTYPHPKL